MVIESSLTQEVGEEIKKPQLDCTSPQSSLTQGDSDSESTSVSSSMQGSISSATSSLDRYSSNVKEESRQKKQPNKLISRKLATSGSFRRRRTQSKLGRSSIISPEDSSTTPPQSSSVEVSDESSNYVKKPMPRFTRTGSLRSVKIFKNKNKNRSNFKSKTSSTDSFSQVSEQSHVEKATFSSILKDSKFPEQLTHQPRPSDPEEVLPVAKICPYQHCSLHGHHHHHEPPLKRFPYLRKGAKNDQKIVKPESQRKSQPKYKSSVKKREVKGTKMGSKVDDFSIEFIAKTRSEPEPVSSHGHGDAESELADMLFGVDKFQETKNDVNDIPVSKDRDFSDLINEKDENSNGSKRVLEKEQSLKKTNQLFLEIKSDINDIPVSKSRDFGDLVDEKDESSNGSKRVLEKEESLKKTNQLSMWRTIHQHIVFGLAAESGDILVPQDEEKPESKEFDDAANQETEIRKMFAIKLVRDAIEKILLPEVQDDQSTTSEVISEQDLSEKSEATSDRKEDSPAPKTKQMRDSKAEKAAPDRWSNLKKVILLTKFVKELEKVKKFNPKKPRHLPLPSEPESETVSLRRQTASDKKNSDEWMLDYALQKVVSELAPTQKRKVALLVKAFETVTPAQDDSQEPESDDVIRRVGSESKGTLQEISESTSFVEKNEEPKLDLDKEKHIKMWHMIYQHVAIDIATKIGPDLLRDGDESTTSEEKNLQEVEERSERSYRLEFTQSDAVKLVRESVDEILLDTQDSRSVASDVASDHEEASEKKDNDDGPTTKLQQQKSKNWAKLKKLIMLKRSIKALEGFRKLKLQTTQHEVLKSGQEDERVDLRRQMMDERKKAEQWMLDYAVQHIVTKLTPARKKRVAMLVEAFEAVVPFPEI